MVEMDMGRVGIPGLCGCSSGGEEWRELKLIVLYVSVDVEVGLAWGEVQSGGKMGLFRPKTVRTLRSSCLRSSFGGRKGLGLVFAVRADGGEESKNL